jgi:hypothetical protein
MPAAPCCSIQTERPRRFTLWEIHVNLAVLMDLGCSKTNCRRELLSFQYEIIRRWRKLHNDEFFIYTLPQSMEYTP